MNGQATTFTSKGGTFFVSLLTAIDILLGWCQNRGGTCMTSITHFIFCCFASLVNRPVYRGNPIDLNFVMITPIFFLHRVHNEDVDERSEGNRTSAHCGRFLGHCAVQDTAQDTYRVSPTVCVDEG